MREERQYYIIWMENQETGDVVEYIANRYTLSSALTSFAREYPGDYKLLQWDLF